MQVQELSKQACLELLARSHLGRLACTQGAQPYVVPIYFAFGDHSLYSFTTVGRKIECMRANPLVCVETDEVVSPQQWVSLMVFGRYEELPDTPQWQIARTFAHKLLKQTAGLREDDSLRGTASAVAGLLPHSNRSDYRSPRHP